MPISTVIIGAGGRGEAYTDYALRHPYAMDVVAVAEPNQTRRERMAARHNIPAKSQFTTWEALLAQARMADAAIICTPDRMHTAPAAAALEAGYQVLLEKPMAPHLDECVSLVQAAEQAGSLLQICHVLRYTALFRKLHQVVHSGRLGDIITIAHRENVASYHMAHSFVRGNWRNTAESSPMILAKCCHDLDLLYWLLGRPVEHLSSVGSLRHFRAENAPDGAPQRCTDGCPVQASCPYFAPYIYLEKGHLVALGIHPALAAQKRWPTAAITEEPDKPDAVRRALETGPYGRCVYHCDNDVVDHQVVSMDFAGGISATLTMHGHSHEEGRTFRIDGTRATLVGKFSHAMWFEIYDHRGGAERHEFNAAGQHGGGDDGLVEAFLMRLNGQAPALTSARASLESHLLAFAAEEARFNHTVVAMDDFRARAGS